MFPGKQTNGFGLQLARFWIPFPGRFCLDDSCVRLSDIDNIAASDYALDYSSTSFACIHVYCYDDAQGYNDTPISSVQSTSALEWTSEMFSHASTVSVDSIDIADTNTRSLILRVGPVSDSPQVRLRRTKVKKVLIPAGCNQQLTRTLVGVNARPLSTMW